MNEFEEKLCGWFSGCFVCLFGCLIPGGYICLQAYAINKASDDGVFIPYYLVCCLGWIGGGINHNKIREIYNIKGSIMADIITLCFCVPCAGCQEYLEVNGRQDYFYHII